MTRLGWLLGMVLVVACQRDDALKPDDDGSGLGGQGSGQGGSDTLVDEPDDGTDTDVTLDTDPIADTVDTRVVELDEDGEGSLALDEFDPSWTYRVVEPPEHGRVTPDYPELQYVPDEDFAGTDQVVIEVDNGVDPPREIVIVFEVAPVNDAPRLEPVLLELDEDGSILHTLEGEDADGDTLVYEVATPPSHGVAVVVGDQLTYTPEIGFHGSDGLVVRVGDGQESVTATVLLQVWPLQFPPTSDDRSFTVPGQVELSIDASDGLLASASHPRGTVAAVAGVVTSTLGGEVVVEADGSFVYHPPVGEGDTVDTFDAQLQASTGELGSVHVEVALTTRVWTVDNRHSGGLGTSWSPFGELTSVEAPSQPGDVIVVSAGDGTDAGMDEGVALKEGQHLLGMIRNLFVDGVVVATGSQAPRISGPGPVVIAESETLLRGLQVESDSGAGVDADDTRGVHIQNVDFTGVQGVSLRNASEATLDNSRFTGVDLGVDIDGSVDATLTDLSLTDVVFGISAVGFSGDLHISELEGVGVDLTALLAAPADSADAVRLTAEHIDIEGTMGNGDVVRAASGIVVLLEGTPGGAQIEIRDLVVRNFTLGTELVTRGSAGLGLAESIRVEGAVATDNLQSGHFLQHAGSSAATTTLEDATVTTTFPVVGLEHRVGVTAECDTDASGTLVMQRVDVDTTGSAVDVNHDGGTCLHILSDSTLASDAEGLAARVRTEEARLLLERNDLGSSPLVLRSDAERATGLLARVADNTVDTIEVHGGPGDGGYVRVEASASLVGDWVGEDGGVFADQGNQGANVSRVRVDGTLQAVPVGTLQP